MNTILHIFATLVAASSMVLLNGCVTKADTPLQYDFGSLPTTNAYIVPDANLPAISLADVHSPTWLNNTMMFYRLAYANEQQPRPYANNRWTMPPAQLFQQRLKSRFSQAGGTIVALSDAALDIPLLRIDLDDSSQTFDSPTHSTAQLTVRASLFNGRQLLGQKTFNHQIPTPTADAAGAARALATANDAAIDAIMSWLSSLQTKK